MYNFTFLIFLIAVSSHVLHAQPGLVGYYSFCNCNANDNSGFGNHGILNGNPTCVPGQREDGFLFNQNPGSNGCGQPGGEYVQLPPLGAIWGGGFTVCAWVRFDLVSYYERIIDFGNGSGDSGGMPIWFGREGSSNNLTLESWINSNGTTNRTLGRLVAPNAITNGSIEYYCATISGDTMRIYVNGVLKAEKKGHPILNVSRSRNFIGRSNWCSNDPDFKGFMDEVRIYNRALTEAEINNLYLETPTFSAYQNPVFSGTQVQLQAQGGIAYEWSPGTSLNDSTISNPIATPYDTTTYTCQVTQADGCVFTDSLSIAVLNMPTCYSICTGSLGENIFPNGDFGSGVPNILPTDPGLAPGYIYTLNPPPNDGYYCIANNTTPWGSFAANAWIDIEDNGPEPNGYMMVVNASYQPGLFYQKTVDVCENTPYEFSIDVISLIFSTFPDKIRPNISFLIDGISVCETGDIAPDEQWHTARFSFITAPGQTTTTLALRNNAPGGNGNDLAIDNISFRTCGPLVTVPSEVNFCNGMPATLHAVLANSPYANTVYQWQRLLNGVWEDVPDADSDSLEILNPVDGSVFRLLAASALPNLSMPNCRIVSETVQLKRLPDLIVNTTAQDVSCSGGSNASASAATFTGASPYEYAWESGESTPGIGNLSVGTYLVTVTDALGCVGVGSVTISEPPLLTTSIASTNISCFGSTGGEVTVAANGGVAPYSYSWSNGETNSTIANLMAGDYLVTITDANACAVSASVTLTEPPLLASSSTTTDVSCFGSNDGNASVSVDGGVAPFGYLWSNGQTNAANTNLSPGVYQVTFTDALGCTGVASLAVSEPPLLTANATATEVSCFGGTEGMAMASVSGGVSPYSFVWSNGQTNAAVSNLSAGVYAYSATDAKGCVVTDTISIAQPPQLSVNTSAVDLSCHGNADGLANATASGGVGPYGFIWSNGQTGALGQNLAAGTYTVTVTDQNGCSSVASVTVIQPLAIQLNVSTISVSCHGAADGTVVANLNGGTHPYAYQWDNGVLGPTNSNLSAGTYSVTATDAHGCTLTAQAAVVQPTALVSDVNAEDLACNGTSTASVSVTVTGGTVPYSFHWNIGANTPQIENLPMGSYTLSITDANGCSLTVSAQINEPPPLLLQTIKTNIRCFGDKNGTLSAIPSGGTPPYVLQWSNGQMTAEIDGLEPGIYTLSITDAMGCSTSTSENLAEPVLQTVHLGLDLVLQLGDIVDLTAIVNIPPSEVMDYTWSGSGDSLQCTDCNTYSFQPTGSGCQQVLVRSKKGCIAADTVCYRISPRRRVYAPNVFTPNGDGSNDFFTIFSDDGVKQILSLKIFNRWGGQVYQANNIKTNDETRGWDGTFKGQELNIDVFVWVAQIEFIDGEIIQMSGDVTLVR